MREIPFQKKAFAKNSSGISRRFRKMHKRPQTREESEREKPKVFSEGSWDVHFYWCVPFFFPHFCWHYLRSRFFRVRFCCSKYCALSNRYRIQEQDIEGDLQKLLRKNLVFLNKSELEKEFLTAFLKFKKFVWKEFPYASHHAFFISGGISLDLRIRKKTLSEEGKLQTNLIPKLLFMNRRGMRTPSRVEKEQDIFSVYEKDPCPSGFHSRK